MTDSQSAFARATRAPSPAAAKRAKRKATLLAAARKLFLERGFEQTSVSAIVAEAGVAQGTFYLYFKTKHAALAHLRLEVLEAYLRAWAEGVASSSEAKADAQLVAGLAAVRDVVEQKRDLVRMLRGASSSAEQQEIWLEGRRQMAGPLAELVAQGVRDGSFVSDNPHMFALLALALFDDLFYEALEFEAPAPLAETFAHGTRFLLNALRCEPARVDALVPAA